MFVPNTRQKSRLRISQYATLAIVLILTQAVCLKIISVESARNEQKTNSSSRSLTNSDAEGPLKIQRRSYEEEGSDTRVPFWNIAHMINSIDEIEPALREGANGIETDISFDKSGNPAESYHGFPCDCGRHCHQRENFIRFVQHIAKITVPPAESQLQLVVLDLKLSELNAQQKEVAGLGLATVLDQHLYRRHLQALNSLRSKRTGRGNDMQFQRPPVRVIVSINHVKDKMLVQSFIRYMRQNRLDFMGQLVGFDVGMNDNLTDISSMWDEFEGASFNIWQGDGLTNCANIIRGVERLKEAIHIRNSQGHFRKIYYWTADVMYQIRAVLRLGLDAILTNQPQRVTQVLMEPEFSGKYRLATHYDDPFAQFWIKPSAWKMPIPSLSDAKETIDNIQKTSAKFVETLPDGIAAALKKVHSKITKQS